jgi:outer membrane protein OmpA-like peptidoglycan-associated protein
MDRARVNMAFARQRSGGTIATYGDDAMTTGTFSNRFVFVRRHGLAAMGLAVLSAGLFLGGCNKDIKAENEALRSENAELKEKVTSTEAERAAMAQKLETTQQSLDQMQKQQVAVAPRQDPYYEPSRSPRQHADPSSRAQQRIRISGDNLFSPGSVVLRSEAKKELSSHLSELKGASQIIVEGYTDSDPIKNPTVKKKYPTNQALSKARAESVKEYLVSRGVSSAKISTVGKGSASPLATKKESRRVELVVVDIDLD